MSDTTVKTEERSIAVHYRGRIAQIGIYLGKFLRMFIYENEWKVLPMAALVAGLVALVMNASFFVTMEGTLMGSFALALVCIWNGCFNSIQVICRERDVIKREHRSGMHISSYIAAHMIYQALLCLLQTGVTLYVMKIAGMHFELCKPLFTPWFIVDLGVSVFLITLAADMMALWISSVTRSTTTAMTVVPFVLIFQLVFSGGMFSLPGWSGSLKNLTISAPGLNVIAAQADHNHLPMVTLWNQVQGMGSRELSATVTLGQVLDFVDDNTEIMQELRSQEFTATVTVGQVVDYLHEGTDPEAKSIREVELDATVTVGELIDMAVEEGLLDEYRDREVTVTRSLGDILDLMAGEGEIEAMRSETFTLSMTIAQLQAQLGVENVRAFLQETVAGSSVRATFEHSRTNVMNQWLRLALIVVVFSSLAVVTLEFIDKDKR